MSAGGGTPLLEVLDLVAVEATGADRFVSTPRIGNGGRIGGSELLTSALLACASSTRADLEPAGVQAMFLRSGRADAPVELAVVHLQDSRTSAVRAVVATQGGTTLMTATYRFVLSRPSVDWQPEFEFDVGPDEGVESMAAVSTMQALQGFDVRAAVHPADGRPVIHPYWVKTKAPLPDDPLLHAALVLYLTDIGTTGSARAPRHTPARPAGRGQPRPHVLVASASAHGSVGAGERGFAQRVGWPRQGTWRGGVSRRRAGGLVRTGGVRPRVTSNRVTTSHGQTVVRRAR